MFYVIEVSNGDAKIKGKSIYEYNTKREAEASYHKKLGTALASDLYTEELIMLTNDKGMIYMVNHFGEDE